VRGQVEIRSGNRLLETLSRNSIFGEMVLIVTVRAAPPTSP
jgi:hypothetical protein